MRNNTKRYFKKDLPQIYQLDIRDHKVTVKAHWEMTFPAKRIWVEKAEKDGFALFLTAYKQLSGGVLKKLAEGVPLFADVKRQKVEDRARFHMGRKMVAAYRRHNITLRMEPS